MRRVVPPILAGVGAALIAGVALTFVLRPGSSVESEVPVNPPEPLNSNNSPALVRNPTQPDNLVVVHRVDRPRYGALLEHSFNGGGIWGSTPLPLPPGTDRPFSPDAAFAPDGTLYVVYANLAPISNVPDNLWLARSGDGGRTLSDPVMVAGALGFQGRVVVDHAGTIHITWLQAREAGLFSLGAPPNPIVASRSTDGGRTFSPPVPVSDPERQRVGAAVPVVDSDGRLVVVYQDFGDDTRDFENLEGPTWEGTFALVLTTSPDGGASFSRGTAVDAEVVPTRRFVAFTPPFPALAAGPNRELVVAWEDGRNGDADVLLQRSPDGGGSWAPPVTVNDDRRNSQYLPAVAVAPDGRIDVVYLDRRRDDANVAVDTYLASAGAGETSFSNVRVSSRPSDSRVGLGTPYGGVDPGSRLGIVSSDSETIAVWVDTRLGTPDTGRQDIVAAVVRRGDSVWIVVIWSLLAGVVAGAVVALAGRREGIVDRTTRRTPA